MQTGSIEGYVVDDKGAPVPAGNVEARNTLRGLVSRSSCNSSGYYRISDLAPGKYSLWAEAKGYSCQWIPTVIIQQGQRARQDFRLSCEKAPLASAYIR